MGDLGAGHTQIENSAGGEEAQLGKQSKDDESIIPVENANSNFFSFNGLILCLNSIKGLDGLSR